MKILNIFNIIFEITYIFLWSIGFYTQIFTTIKKKNGNGFSLNYQFLFLISSTYFSIYSTYLAFKEPKFITIIDSIYAIQASLIGSILFVLTLLFPRSSNKLSWSSFIIIFSTFFMIFIYYFFFFRNGLCDFYEFFLFIGYSKVNITIVKYLYQIFLNFDRKNTFGFSVYYFLFYFFGAFFSLVPIIIYHFFFGE